MVERLLTENWSRWGRSSGHRRTRRTWSTPWSSCMLKGIGKPSWKEPADTGSTATRRAKPTSWQLASSCLAGSHVWRQQQQQQHDDDDDDDGGGGGTVAPRVSTLHHENAALAPWHQQISCSSLPSVHFNYLSRHHGCSPGNCWLNSHAPWRQIATRGSWTSANLCVVSNRTSKKYLM